MSQSKVQSFAAAIVLSIALQLSSPAIAEGNLGGHHSCQVTQNSLYRNISSAVKARFIQGMNALMKFYNRNTNLEGQTIIADSSASTSFTFGKKLGMGFWGSVYELSAVSLRVGANAKSLHATLREVMEKPQDYVIKVANDAPWPMSLKGQKVLRNEFFESTGIEGALKKLGQASIPGGEVLLISSKGRTFLIKRKYSSGSSIENGGIHSGNIAEYREMIEKGIFEPAKVLFQETGVAIDLRAENIFLDRNTGTIKMWETTLAQPATANLVKGSFEQYMAYFESAMKQYVNQVKD